MSLLEVKNLNKRFGDVVAVRDVSFSIVRGEVFGFLGPNGAGKTTTINMLTGLARPTSGSIWLSNIDCVNDTKKAQQKIGIVPDESNLYDEMDGFENLCFCAALYGMKKKERERRARELLQLFGLDSVGKRPFRAYSKGMKRKLTIAAGIIHEPELLYLDEPTTGIDVESARQIRSLSSTLNQKGMTIFLTTHYIEDAERLCDRIGFIVGGSVVRLDRVTTLIEDAQKESVVQFSLADGAKSVARELSEHFPAMTVAALDDHSIQVRSKNQLQLMPFMQFFTARGCPVYEARRIKPTLEDVFVQVTGVALKQQADGMGGSNR